MNNPPRNRRPGADPAPPPPRTKRRRLTDGIVGLSAVAIVSIYGLGYARTQSAASGVPPAGDSGSAQASPASPSTGASASQAPNAPAPQVQRSQAPQITPTPAQSQAGSYRDGTYVGLGTSRHGDIQATVVVKGGKITSASISSCMTRYSCSLVNPLVSEVVSTQKAPVHRISGATDSSRAYQLAIQSALSKAG